MINFFHPALPFLAAAVLYPLCPARLRKILVLAAPTVALLFLLKIHAVSRDVSSLIHLQEYPFVLMRLDALAFLFLAAFILFGFLANLYALQSNDLLIPIGGNLYVASSIAAVLAGDLITLFVFWEIMAITSALLIWNKARLTSKMALFRYFLVHLTGGLFFFAGIMMKILSHHSLLFTHLDGGIASWFIFAGFALNAALIPLHAWLPDAYPEGTPEGSVYLSAFTTKVAVYAFARAFAGEELLIWIGLVTAVIGVLYALMENDMRRLLSYHIVCQIGYMVCGIGFGTGLGLSAGTGHAFGNIFFKGLLFMATGALIHMTGKSKLSDLGNLSTGAKQVFVYYLIGAFAISGFPLLNGYVTKSLLIDAAHEIHQPWIATIFLWVAAGTFMSIALKLAYFAFLGNRKQTYAKLQPLPWNMSAAMGGASLVCIGVGLFPNFFFNYLPSPVHESVYTTSHIVETLQLLAGAFLAFLVLLPKLHPHERIILDVDWIYRKAARLLLDAFCRPITRGQDFLQESLTRLLSLVQRKMIAPQSAEQKIISLEFPLKNILAGSLVVTGFILLAHFFIARFF